MAMVSPTLFICVVSVSIGLGKFFKGKSRNLGHDVVNRGLKTGLRLPRDIVGQFVQAITHGQLGGDLGNGKARGFRRQGTGATDAGIHFDHDHATRLRMHGELDVGATRLHANFSDNGQTGIAHPLIFFIGQGLSRSHRDGIARVNPHGIEVLDGTDDHDVVIEVTHDLHLVFFPADNRLFDQALR